MEEKILTFLKSVGENYGPAIVAGAVGAIIARLRHRMSPRQFIGSIIISIFVSVSVGAVAKDYLLIQQESIINVLCGVSGVFSKTILDELEEIIKNSSDIVKIKMGVNKNKEENTTE